MSVFGSMKIFTKYSKEQQAKYDIKYTKDRTNMDMKLKLMLETNCSFGGGVGWRGASFEIASTWCDYTTSNTQEGID